MKGIISVVLIVFFIVVLSNASFATELHMNVQASDVVESHVKYEIVSQSNNTETATNTIGSIAKIDMVSDLTLKDNLVIPYAGMHPAMIVLLIVLAIAVIAFICYRVIEI